MMARRKGVGIDEIIRLRRQGLTVTQIANELGVTQPTISHRIAKLERGNPQDNITMFQTGITHLPLPRIEPVRIKGGPRDGEYNPEPRPVAATPEQMALLRQGAPALAQSSKKSQAADPRFELVGISSGDKTRIAERYQMGESIADLAASYTTSGARIREILVLAGVEIRPRRGSETEQATSSPEFIHERSKDMSLTAKDIDAIVDAHANGASVPELADRYSSNEATINYHIARRGRVAKVAKSVPATTPEPEPIKRSEKQIGKSKTSDKVEISDDLVRSWVIGNKRDQISVASLSRASGVSHYVITRRIADYLETNPDFAAKIDQLKLTKAPDSSTKVDGARQMLISDQAVRELNARYLEGESLPAIVGDYSITFSTAVNYFKRLGLTYPRPKAEAQADCITTVAHPGHAAAAVTLREYGFDEDEIAAAIAKDTQPELPKATEPVTKVTAAPPADDQMDDPELMVAAAVEAPVVDEVAPLAAAPEPPPADEDVAAVARQRARELHRKAQGAHMVVAAQELPTHPVLARKQYSAPRILESGAMFVNNPHAAAKLVEGLVAELNQVPGVQAYFEWRSQGAAGQPLAR